MGSAVSLVGAGISLVSGVASVVQSGQQAKSAARAASQSAAIETGQIEAERENARLDAAQMEAERRRDLAGILSSQRAILGTNGLDLSSPTNDAIQAASIEEAERDIRDIQINEGRTYERLDREQQGVGIRVKSASDSIAAARWRGITQGVTGIMSGAAGLYDGVRAYNEEAFISEERARQASRGRNRTTGSAQ